MPFEVFQKRSVPRNNQPLATIQASGAMSLNQAAFEAAGSPKFVELLFDREQGIIGLRPAPDDSLNAYPMRPQGAKANTYILASKAFMLFYGIQFGVPVRYPVKFVDDLLIIDLKGPSQEARSNRKSKAAPGGSITNA